MGETATWTQLLIYSRFYDEDLDDAEHLQFLRNKWVFGASEWLAGKNGSKENDKALLGYTDEQWNYIWSTMIEDGAWAVPSVKDNYGNHLKENHSPELFIKFIAHDLQCNIVVIDLYNHTVQFCSGNSLLDNNVKFDSPLLLYTTGSHFQSVFPNDHEYFVQYANELELNMTSREHPLPTKRKRSMEENPSKKTKSPESE